MVSPTAEEPVSRHKCLIYEGHPSEQLPVVVPLLMDGLKDNWRCLYLGDPTCVTMINSALSEKGVDTGLEAERGSLVFSSARDHLEGGQFDPPALVDALCSMIDDAVRDGYKGLCATGDMMWELGTEKNFERLLEYEALLEQVFQQKPLQGICQYRRDVLPNRAVSEALTTHRSVYIGKTLSQDNIFFMPPEFLLQHNPAARDAQGEWMCEQLLRVMKAEQKRDQALTSLKKSEARQRQLAERLSEANRDLEQRVQERTAALEVTNNELQEFSYAVSHDLRAPLRAIDSLSMFVAEDFGDRLGDEGIEQMTQIRKRVQGMNRQIDGMLALARLSQAELHLEKVDLTEVATTIGADLRSGDPRRQVELEVQPGLTAWADPALIRAVFENLIGNAWKFTSKRDVAHIYVGEEEAQGQAQVFFVRDDGAGFDMRHVDQLFAPFRRLHTPQEFPGHGIGLATVQRIVQRHGGSIWAEGQVDQGATFRLALPVMDGRGGAGQSAQLHR